MNEWIDYVDINEKNSSYFLYLGKNNNWMIAFNLMSIVERKNVVDSLFDD